jgi:hypothetical protein
VLLRVAGMQHAAAARMRRCAGRDARWRSRRCNTVPRPTRRRKLRIGCRKVERAACTKASPRCCCCRCAAAMRPAWPPLPLRRLLCLAAVRSCRQRLCTRALPLQPAASATPLQAAAHAGALVNRARLDVGRGRTTKRGWTARSMCRTLVTVPGNAMTSRLVSARGERCEHMLRRCYDDTAALMHRRGFRLVSWLHKRCHIVPRAPPPRLASAARRARAARGRGMRSASACAAFALSQ